MSSRPSPQARLLDPGVPAPDGWSVWVFEGSLERFAGGTDRFRYRQRIAWPEEPSWDQVQEFGRWTMERLSINGHILLGLRARPEAAPAAESRLITPDDE